uniref:uncharacterized mitochondrial protein AtMg00810-like n=1 Tax=Erigeron canadensis TaxID=72917 RepID=UPI001CB88E7A|nr:uncharacterized mitochondrial protein AtMg00810-like [Erigeron canadensis]
MCRDFEKVMKSEFEMSAMGELSFFLGLQVVQKKDGIFIHQTKYVNDILERFKMTDAKSIAIPIPVNHQLGAVVDSDELADPRASHLSAVKRIFRYLKGRPKLGIWYPSKGDLDFVAYSDADYGGCNLMRKSTSGGCQFLRGRIVLWIQQQLRDYGLNFTNTPIMVDNESTISITNTPIEIKHHFIRDCAEKRLIHMVKVQSDYNYADLFTKAFDRSRFDFLLQANGMRNPE